MNYIVKLLVRASYQEDIPFGKFIFSNEFEAKMFYETLCDGIFNNGSAIDGYIAVVLSKEVVTEQTIKSVII